MTTTPLLRWPGGKRTLLPALLARVPERFGCLHEPFAGGGALTFALAPAGGYMSDLNAELINFYRVLKQTPRAMIDYLLRFPVSKADYYRIRNEDRNLHFAAASPAYRAARYLYLNRTCFNGLMTVNKSGQISVSCGKPLSEARVYATDNIWEAHAALRAVRIYHAPYAGLLERVHAGDFVYLDPPYVPVRTGGNLRYTAHGFTFDDQGALAQLCGKLTQRGVKWMLSNANVSFIKKLYGHYTVEEIDTRRSISGSAAARGTVTELLVRNY